MGNSIKIRLPRKQKKDQKINGLYFLTNELEYKCWCDKWGYVMRTKSDIVNNPKIYSV